MNFLSVNRVTETANNQIQYKYIQMLLNSCGESNLWIKTLQPGFSEVNIFVKWHLSFKSSSGCPYCRRAGSSLTVFHTSNSNGRRRQSGAQQEDMGGWANSAGAPYNFLRALEVQYRMLPMAFGHIYMFRGCSDKILHQYTTHTTRI